MRRAFHYESSTLKQAEEERTERLRSTHSCFGPMPGALQQRERERERAGEYMGQIFPWQDPRDAAESRVQPVKGRLRAQQSISGLHLHNKWSSRGFSSACTRTHTHHSSTHQHMPTQGRSDEEDGEKKRAAFMLEWHSLAETTRTSHPHLYCWMTHLRSYKLNCFGKFTAALTEKVIYK